MSIETKDWYAHNNKMPGSVGLIVSGTVTVPSSNAVPKLVVPIIQDKSLAIRLELIIEQNGIGATVMTEKEVRLFVPRLHDVPQVAIFYNGEPLAYIDEVPSTH